MDSGKARSHRDGGGFSAYLQRKYADSPRPSGTPLINAGGKKTTWACFGTPFSFSGGKVVFVDNIHKCIYNEQQQNCSKC